MAPLFCFLFLLLLLLLLPLLLHAEKEIAYRVCNDLLLLQLLVCDKFSRPHEGVGKIYHIFLHSFELTPLYNGLWDPF